MTISKKIVAVLAAASMMLSLSVAAFADSATYDADEEKVSVTCSSIDADNQWTVIIIDADMQLENLTADDLYYINQGTSGDTFWTAMGTKEALEDGDYLVRIGGTNLSEVIEIDLTVSSTPSGTSYTVGDLNGDNNINVSDLSVFIDFVLEKISSFTDSGSNVLPKQIADLNGDTNVNVSDLSVFIDYILEKIDSFSNETYTLPSGTTAASTY